MFHRTLRVGPDAGGRLISVAIAIEDLPFAHKVEAGIKEGIAEHVIGISWAIAIKMTESDALRFGTVDMVLVGIALRELGELHET